MLGERKRVVVLVRSRHRKESPETLVEEKSVVVQQKQFCFEERERETKKEKKKSAPMIAAPL